MIILFTSAREFDKHVKINESRLVYLKILPKISEVEEFDIAGAISQELMDAIIEAAQGSGMSSDYAKIYRLLKPAVANISMAKALDYISTAIYAEGIQLHLLHWKIFCGRSGKVICFTRRSDEDRYCLPE
jgi:hypothetical protein